MKFNFGSYMGQEGEGVKLKTQIHLVPTLRMNGAVLHSRICFHDMHRDGFKFYFVLGPIWSLGYVSQIEHHWFF